MNIRGHKGQNSTEVRGRGFLALGSRCRGFSILEYRFVAFFLRKNALESRCLGLIVSVSQCRGVLVSRILESQ